MLLSNFLWQWTAYAMCWFAVKTFISHSRSPWLTGRRPVRLVRSGVCSDLVLTCFRCVDSRQLSKLEQETRATVVPRSVDWPNKLLTLESKDSRPLRVITKIQDQPWSGRLGGVSTAGLAAGLINLGLPTSRDPKHRGQSHKLTLMNVYEWGDRLQNLALRDVHVHARIWRPSPRSHTLDRGRPPSTAFNGRRRWLRAVHGRSRSQWERYLTLRHSTMSAEPVLSNHRYVTDRTASWN